MSNLKFPPMPSAFLPSPERGDDFVLLQGRQVGMSTTLDLVYASRKEMSALRAIAEAADAYVNAEDDDRVEQFNALNAALVALSESHDT